MQKREGLKKRPMTSDQQLGSQCGRGQYGSYGKLHYAVCRSRGRGCYNCGRIYHVSRDCPHGARPLCFLCDLVGLKRVVCLRRRGVVSAPIPAILRISNSYEGRAGAPAEKSGDCSVRQGRSVFQQVILWVCYHLCSFRMLSIFRCLEF